MFRELHVHLLPSQPRATIWAEHMDHSHVPRQFRARRPSRIVALLDRHAPFWEPQLVVATAIGLDFFLSRRVTVGPSWMLPGVEGLLLIGLSAVSLHPSVHHSRLRRRIAIGLIGMVSAVNTFSLIVLCHLLVNGTKASGRSLVLTGVLLWVTNVLLFGLWFYELDRGGPIERSTRNDAMPDFMFVQMGEGSRFAPPRWMPRLVDYLYLSFTNATAFSPTDTMPLSAAAKWLMSAQALGSLITVGLVVARAVNILNS